MNKGLLLLIWVWILLSAGSSGLQSNAQNAPITSIATVGNAVPGQPVVVPVTVTSFNNIGSMTLTLDYDYSKLHYTSALKNPALSGSFNVGDNDMGNGIHRLVLGWFGSGVSLPDGSSLVDYTFEYQMGTAPLTWFDMGPSCEYTNPSATILNDIPTSTYYINGLVCGALPDPGPISGINTLCQGQAAVSYGISPMSNVLGYNWLVPPGAVLTSGANTNSILVDYPSDALSGNITVCGIGECGNGPVAVLLVTVNPLPVANAGNDITIGYSTSTQLNAASGGPGIINYHWSPENLLLDPDIQNPQTIQLTSGTVFHLEVTNAATLCLSGDEMTVNITGGPLGVNPMAVPFAVCRGQNSQLYANAGGGSGIYTYSWTCVPAGNPPWSSAIANPIVSPDSSTQYLVSVYDDFNTTSGTTGLEVHQLPKAFMSGGGQICDDGSVVSMQVDLTGTAPWTIMYSDGFAATTINGIMQSPYIITTSAAGQYSVIAVIDQYCQGTASGTAVITVFPVPAAPVISLIGYLLSSDAVFGNQWYRNDTAIAGADGQFLTAEVSGFYSDIESLNGCSSDTSNVIEVVITGLSDNLLNSVIVYPNPFKNNCYLIIPGHLSLDLILSIYNCNGKMVRQTEISTPGLHNSIKLDFNELSPGMYILQLRTDSGIRRIKLLLQ